MHDTSSANKTHEKVVLSIPRIEISTSEKLQKSKQKMEIPIYRIKISIAQTLKNVYKKYYLGFQDWDFDFRKPSKMYTKIAISTSGIWNSTFNNDGFLWPVSSEIAFSTFLTR